jgi:hypothetical protein
METLQLALEQELLTLAQGQWTCSDPGALQAELHEGGALKRRVAELKREQSWLLLLLAAAGTPLSRVVLAELVNRTGASCDNDLIDLEKKGFIARAGDEYRVAHDEIAELAVEAAPDEAASAAFGAIGSVLLEYGWDDLGLLTQAGPYLSRAGDTRRLRSAFRRKVWLARSRGDRRSLLELARETTGTIGSNRQAAKLVRRLPLYMRLGLSSGKRVAGTATVSGLLAVAAIAMWLAPDGPGPDMNFLLFEENRGSVDLVFGAELRSDGWESQTTIDPSRQLMRAGTTFRGTYIRGMVTNPDGTVWAMSIESRDTGGIDVFLGSGDGIVEPLTFAPGDDKPFTWSPDGRLLAITTARWSDRSMYDLATLDVDTRALTRLTDTEALELHPQWSPDGTRIAFLRQTTVGTNKYACWITVDGATPTCTPIPFYSSLRSWLDDQRLLLVVSDAADDFWLSSLDLSSGHLNRIARAGDREPSVSPDGEWIACYCESEPGTTARWHVFSVDNPTEWKPLNVEHDAPEALLAAWVPGNNPNRYLDRIEAEGPRKAQIGVPAWLQFRARDASDNPATFGTMRWISLDTILAAIDALGVMRPKETGSVTIVVSAGGWRADSLEIEIVEQEQALALEERWDGDASNRWRFYGEPTPQLVTGPEAVPAFWNSGDASYTSGAYSDVAWSANRGLGVTAKVSLPITAGDQQEFYLRLEGSLEPENLDTWNHRTGPLPGRNVHSDRRCSTWIQRLPGSESLTLALAAAGDRKEVALDLPLGSDRWHTLDLQIFTDRTCGVAIDGHALARAEARVPLDVEYRVLTEGRSVGTRLLVGPLQVWEGVRTDVDWVVLEREERDGKGRQGTGRDGRGR